MSDKLKQLIKQPRKGLLMLSLPMIIAFSVHTLFNIVDTFFVGRLGADAVAALTMAFPVQFLLIALGGGIGVGATSLISRRLGEKNKRAANKAAEHAIVFSVIVGILITILGIILTKPILLLMGAKGNYLEYGIQYLTVIFLGSLFMFFDFIANSVLRGEGDTKNPMKFMIIAMLINIALDPIFIFVLGLGVKGAAIATVISRFITALLIINHILIKKKSGFDIRLKHFKYSWNTLKNILIVGVPTSISQMTMVVGFMILNWLVSRFGAIGISAIGLGHRVESLIILPLIGLSAGAITVAGYFKGAKEYKKLKSIINFSFSISTAWMTLSGILLFIFAKPMISFFINNPEVILTGTNYLRFVVFSFPFAALGIISIAIFQGIGRGLPGMVMNTLRTIVIVLLISLVLMDVYGYGIEAIFISILVANVISGVISSIWLKLSTRKFLRTA